MNINLRDFVHSVYLATAILTTASHPYSQDGRSPTNHRTTLGDFDAASATKRMSPESTPASGTCQCTCSGNRQVCEAQPAKGEKGEKGDRGDRGRPGPAGPPGPPGFIYSPPEGRPRVRSHRRANQQVAFSVARSNKLGPVARNTPIAFDRIITNAGTGFDSSASEFIAKINGTYAFFAHVMATGQAEADAWIMHNDKHQLPLFGDMRAGYATGSNVIILELSSSDRVWVQLSAGSAILNDYTSFSGYLLYEH